MIRQLSIGARASAAFGLIGILTLILGIFALNRMGAIETQLNVISNEQVPAVDNVNDLDREFLRVRIHSANVATYVDDPTRLEKYKESLQGAIDSLKRNQDEYEATIEDPEVYTRPWKIVMPLYRRIEENARILEFKCVEFAEDAMYGHLRKGEWMREAKINE